MTVDGSERVELLAHNGINYPNWTPDSARILFDTGFNIGIINSDGQNFQSLYAYDGTHPTVSPNGATIAYESENSDIIITDLGRQEQRNLTDSPGSVDQDPDWR
jgi:Tol biopolymer transport system component